MRDRIKNRRGAPERRERERHIMGMERIILSDDEPWDEWSVPIYNPPKS